jgi:hypothetical protein
MAGRKLPVYTTLNARPSTYQGRAKWAWHMAIFLSQGHITPKNHEKHVAFVVEVIASLMEKAIFAYLGLFFV